MIARIWTAQTTQSRASEYAEHLRMKVLPKLRKLAGYAGARLLERKSSDVAEIIVVTFWESIEAIRNFAGADMETAVVADEAAALLTQFDERVRHSEVAVTDEV